MRTLNLIDTLQYGIHPSVLPYLTFMELVMLLQVSRSSFHLITTYWDNCFHTITYYLLNHPQVGSRVMNFLPRRALFPSISHCLWHIRGFMPRQKVFFQLYECRDCGHQSESPEPCARCELERVHLALSHDNNGNWTWVTC